MRTKIVFHVESDEYCDQSETLAALGYEFVDFYLVVTFPNGLRLRGDGPTDENRACLGQSVVRQLNTIRALEGELAARDARISALKFELDMGLAQKLVWQDIHARLKDNQLTWTEAFGMPMEDALRRLAENFDRRPAANVKEV